MLFSQCLGSRRSDPVPSGKRRQAPDDIGQQNGVCLEWSILADTQNRSVDLGSVRC